MWRAPHACGPHRTHGARTQILARLLRWIWAAVRDSPRAVDTMWRLVAAVARTGAADKRRRDEFDPQPLLAACLEVLGVHPPSDIAAALPPPPPSCWPAQVTAEDMAWEQLLDSLSGP